MTPHATCSCISAGMKRIHLRFLRFPVALVLRFPFLGLRMGVTFLVPFLCFLAVSELWQLAHFGTVRPDG